QRVAANQNFGATSGANNWNLKTVTFSNSNGTATPARITTQTGGTGTITVSSMTISRASDASGATTTLDPGDVTWIISGTGVVFTETAGLGSLCAPATCAANASTFKYTGATATTIGASAGYYNLMSTPTIGGAITYTGGGVITVANDFTMNPTAASGN